MLVDDVSHGTLFLYDTGQITYFPDRGFNGIDTFTYIANDGLDVSNVATVTITVTSNILPQAANDAYSTDAGVALSVPAPGVLHNDADTDGPLALAATLVTGPANGVLNLIGDGGFSYQPDGGFSGTDTFTYRATDGLDDSNVATVTITVNPAPPPTCTGVCLSIDDVSRSEGSMGTTKFVFTISLSTPSQNKVSVLVDTIDGTPQSNDYVPIVAKIVSFKKGETTQTIAVNVKGDHTLEPNETFLVQLSSPVNAGISDGQGTGTILNDD